MKPGGGKIFLKTEEGGRKGGGRERGTGRGVRWRWRGNSVLPSEAKAPSES